MLAPRHRRRRRRQGVPSRAVPFPGVAEDARGAAAAEHDEASARDVVRHREVGPRDRRRLGCERAPPTVVLPHGHVRGLQGAAHHHDPAARHVEGHRVAGAGDGQLRGVLGPLRELDVAARTAIVAIDVAVVAALADREVDVAVAAHLLGLAVERAAVAGHQVAVVADLAVDRIRDPVGASSRLAVRTARRIGQHRVVAALVADLGEHRIEVAVAARRRDAAGLAEVSVVEVAVVARFAEIDRAVAAGVVGPAVGGAFVGRIEVAVVADLVLLDHPVATARRDADAGPAGADGHAGVRARRSIRGGFAPGEALRRDAAGRMAHRLGRTEPTVLADHGRRLHAAHTDQRHQRQRRAHRARAPTERVYGRHAVRVTPESEIR